MPIRFRCPHCHGLMAISTRRIGATVPCSHCSRDTVVPAVDTLELPASPPTAVPNQSPSLPLEKVSRHEPPAEQFSQPLPSEQEKDATPDSNQPPGAVAPDTVERLEPLTPAPRKERGEKRSIAENQEDESEAPAFTLKRPGRFAEEELDLTAMVDVVFQLLIFFMVTASFSLQKSIEVPTPDEPDKGVSQSFKPLEELQDVAILVAIDDRNGITIDEDPLTDISQLPDVLRDHMRRDQKSEMIVTSSRNATHRTVISVIDAANSVGMQRIRMGTSASGDGSP